MSLKSERTDCPLPMASEFAAYERTCPGAAERILKLAEEEQEHRHKLETLEMESWVENRKKQGHIIDGAVFLEKSKLLIGCFVITLLIVSAVCLAFFGKTTEAIVALVVPFFTFLTYTGIGQWRKSPPHKDS